MNDLKVKIGGDETGFDRAIAETKRATMDYQAFWKGALEKQEQEEVKSAREAARRSNQARRLMRQRADQTAKRERLAEEQALASAVEQAHRNNLARRLRRERAAAREERLARERENSFIGRARNRVGGFIGGIGGQLAGAISFYGMQAALRSSMQYAGQLTDLSARTGVSVEALQRLDRAAKENGTSLDALVGLWERVGSAREDALRDKKGGAAKAFGALGVDIGMLKTSSPDDIVRKIAEQFQNSTNVEQLIAPLREIGGRGAGQMVALFRAGLDQQYQDMQVMTAAQADVLDELGEKWDSMGNRIMVGVAPAIIWLIDVFGWLQDRVEETVEGFASAWRWMVGNQGKGMGAKDALAGVTDAFVQGVMEASGEIEDRNDQKAKARADRIARRLQFGKFDSATIQEKEEKESKGQKMRELQLDTLSKAGLFAGGAGQFTALNNIPAEQLKVMREIVRVHQNTYSLVMKILG